MNYSFYLREIPAPEMPGRDLLGIHAVSPQCFINYYKQSCYNYCYYCCYHYCRYYYYLKSETAS